MRIRAWGSGVCSTDRAPRTTWKGYVKVAELAFPVALYAGETAAKRVSFHILNRKTGNRVHREYIDEETGKPVEREQQVKGYETGEDQYVILQPEEIAEVVPESRSDERRVGKEGVSRCRARW